MTMDIAGDRQDVPVYAWCDRCGGELYGEDWCHEIGGQIICADCLMAFVQDWLLPHRMRVCELGKGMMR